MVSVCVFVCVCVCVCVVHCTLVCETTEASYIHTYVDVRRQTKAKV